MSLLATRIRSPVAKILPNLVDSIQSKNCTLIQHTPIRCLRSFQEKTIRAMYWRSRSFDVVKYPVTRRDKFTDWNYRSEIFAFSRRLQENLGEDTLRQIFTHPSYVTSLQLNQSKYNLPAIKLESNEEFVRRGDELLEECIKPYLRYHFDRMPEDGIIDIKDYLKSKEVLADIAKWIGCKDIILTSEWPPSSEIIADTVLALIAGIEKDLGLDRVQRFVVDMIISYLNDKDVLEDIWIIPNPIETLNMILKNSSLPNYEPRLMFQTGVKTLEPCHIIGLYVNQKFIGSSPGETLEIAEHCAALDALERLFDLTHSRTPFIYGEASERLDYKAHSGEHDYIKTWRFTME